MLGLCKHRMENYQALEIMDLSVGGRHCKTSLLIGCLGYFGKKPRLAFAKEFRPGGTFVLIGDVSMDSPPITTNDLPLLLNQAYQALNSDADLKVVEWARGVFG